MLTLAMDANFRLRSKLRGVTSDPMLGAGLAYFVDHQPYAPFIAKYVDEAEVSLALCFTKSNR